MILLTDFIFNAIINVLTDIELKHQHDLQPDIAHEIIQMSLSNKSSHIMSHDHGDSAFEDTTNKATP